MTDPKCGICLSLLHEPGLGCQVLSCGHALHEQCILKARRQFSTPCPFCGTWCPELLSSEDLYLEAESRAMEGQYAEAARLCAEALDIQEHPKAAGRLGFLYAHGLGVDRNTAKAVDLLRLGVDGGSHVAACELGVVYLSGIGVEKDAAEALNLFLSAHRAGNSKATYFLGEMYLFGDGVPKDAKQAGLYLFQALSCGQKISDQAALMIGMILLKGEEVDKDESKAAKFLEESHKSGNPMASLMLGDIFRRQRDFVKAAKFHEAAHWGGHARGHPIPQATFFIGSCYYTGQGVQMDCEKGMYFLILARNSGNHDAAEAVESFQARNPSLDMVALSTRVRLLLAPEDATDFSAFALQARAEIEWQRIQAGHIPERLKKAMAMQKNATKADAMIREEPFTRRIHLLELFRCPQALSQVLLDGEHLKTCREALAKYGFNPELPSGAKTFVNPEEFEAVLGSLEDTGTKLKPWHVLFSESFESAIMDALASLPSRARVCEKSRTILESPPSCAACGTKGPRFRCQRCGKASYCSKECQLHDWKYHRPICAKMPPTIEDTCIPTVIKRTFLEVHVGSSMRSPPTSGTKTASTTDADVRKHRNPRYA